MRFVLLESYVQFYFTIYLSIYRKLLRSRFRRIREASDPFREGHLYGILSLRLSLFGKRNPLRRFDRFATGRVRLVLSRASVRDDSPLRGFKSRLTKLRAESRTRRRGRATGDSLARDGSVRDRREGVFNLSVRRERRRNYAAVISKIVRVYSPFVRSSPGLRLALRRLLPSIGRMFAGIIRITRRGIPLIK